MSDFTSEITREEFTKLAEQAGIVVVGDAVLKLCQLVAEYERERLFNEARHVINRARQGGAKIEREECAKLSQRLLNPYVDCRTSSHAYEMAIVDYYKAIRARGQQ